MNKRQLLLLIGLISQVFLIKAQSNFVFSSVGNFSNANIVSAPVQFKSVNNCIDVQTGMAILKGERAQGIFVVNCALEEDFSHLGLRLYPNPVTANSILRLIYTPQLTKLFKVQVWTEEGKLIQTRSETGYSLYQGIKMNLSHLHAGGYILMVESEKQREYIKFLKAN